MRSISTCLFVVLLACVCQSLVAQKLIALQHDGAASFFTTSQSAYDAAVNGDTLYFPGGNFDGFDLSKSLALIGVGHHPDSTSATGRTVLSYLNINPGSDSSFITGISNSSAIYSYGDIYGVTISRCYLNQGFVLYNGSKTNWVISENWIGESPCSWYCGYSIQIQNASTSFFLSNNVIQTRVANLTTSEISNNIFLSNALEASNSTIRNNVFVGNYVGSTSNCQWSNNLNAGVNGGPTGSGNTGSGNYLDDIPLTTAFANYSAGNGFYQNDFHIVNPTYLGDDAASVGIYGGLFPWKAGSIPFNPHVQSKIINSGTNADGSLHINIVVKAQGN